MPRYSKKELKILHDLLPNNILGHFAAEKYFKKSLQQMVKTSPVFTKNIIDIIYKKDIKDIPLYLNHVYPFNIIAKWRLRIGK